MTSELQKFSNRKNSQKSIGPKSPNGKRISSLNAIRHGIFAESNIIPGEDPNEYLELINAVFFEFAPQGALEKFFLNQAVRAIWRLRRLDGAEQTYYAKVRSAISHRTLKRSGSTIHEGMTLKEASEEWTRWLQEMNAEAESERDGQPLKRTFSNVIAESDDKQTEMTSSEIMGSTILEANVAGDERSPMAEIERRRRAFMRDVMGCFQAFFDLKERRSPLSI